MPGKIANPESRSFRRTTSMIPDALKVVLERYPKAAQPLGEPEPLGNAGGFSGAQLWRFSSGIGTLAARAWPIEGPPAAALQQIHDWLALTRTLGFVATPQADRL